MNEQDLSYIAGYFDGEGSIAYIGLMAVAIAWWFKARDEDKKNGG